MLVLSRQRDETIMIGDEIEITVVDIRGDKIRLGINAPAKVTVHRKEVYEAIRQENIDAARSAANSEIPSGTPFAGKSGGSKPRARGPGKPNANGRLSTPLPSQEVAST
jgi:carbon storage regulator